MVATGGMRNSWSYPSQIARDLMDPALRCPGNTRKRTRSRQHEGVGPEALVDLFLRRVSLLPHAVRLGRLVCRMENCI